MISSRNKWAVALLALAGASYAGLVSYAFSAEEMPARTARSGGAATVNSTTDKAFSLSAPNLTSELRQDFSFGNRLFNTNWVIAPSSTTTFDGLGPTFNRVSCSACHLKDGRGRPPEKPDEMMDSMLIRLSIPGVGEHGGVNPHPNYGDQLEDRSIPGVTAEGYATVSYEIVKGKYKDGTPYSLAKPTYHFHNLGFGPLGDNVLFSPRVAPAVFGVGLLEAIPEETILAKADPDDKNGDGISGRPNMVWDIEKKAKALGRFGWKANQPTIRQQDAGAMSGDVGLTTSLHPEKNCPGPQKECAAAPDGGSPEVSDDFMNRLVHYNQTIAVPAARDLDDKDVQRGEKLFGEMQCSGCHTPTTKTGKHEIKQLSEQTIHPFTDLLLHDMGEGLADHRPDFEASGTEWRTPPLWGIGLTQTVNGHTRFMHDGRARNVEEAILWHGGEAEKAKQQFMALPKKDREAVIKFLNSL